eukprot:scaffold6049_cov41-Attheya_sp.AAC.3
MVQVTLFFILATVSSFLGSTGVVAYSAGTIGASFGTRRSTMTMRKGRKGLNKGINESIGDSNVRPMGGESTTPMSSSKKASHWVPVVGLPSMADLPNSESGSEIKLVDTMADVLMNGATNPTGAVAVTNYMGKTYCFASACSTCKIPLTKARVMAPNAETNNVDPRLL